MSETLPAVRPQIAVVIATRARPELLRRCLSAVLNQDLGGERFEVLVVDDGPDAGTLEVVSACDARTGGAPAVRYLRNTRGPGPAGARNCGWRASAAAVIAFTDDDTVPDRAWLSEGLRAMDGPLWAAAGRVVVPLQGPITDHARMTQGLESAEFVTANAFVRREALVQVGGFDERFRRAWREDSDLHFSLLEAGARVGRAPRAVVLHPVRPAPWGISLRQQANVCFDALLFKKHPVLYRSRIRRSPPWLYLAIAGCSLAAVGVTASGRLGWALGFAGLAATGMALFAWRRLRGTSHAPSHVAEMVLTSVAIPYLALAWRVVGSWRFKVIYP